MDAVKRIMCATKSTEQIPSCKTSSCLVCQEIPHILWNQNLYFHVSKNPPLVPYLRQMTAVHILETYLCKINFIIILPSTSRSCRRPSLSRSSYRNFVCVFLLSHACYMSDVLRKYKIGGVIAQVISHRLHTAEAWFQSHVGLVMGG